MKNTTVYILTKIKVLAIQRPMLDSPAVPSQFFMLHYFLLAFADFVRRWVIRSVDTTLGCLKKLNLRWCEVGGLLIIELLGFFGTPISTSVYVLSWWSVHLTGVSWYLVCNYQFLHKWQTVFHAKWETKYHQIQCHMEKKVVPTENHTYNP